jgi:hypothetical protein
MAPLTEIPQEAGRADARLGTTGAVIKAHQAGEEGADGRRQRERLAGDEKQGDYPGQTQEIEQGESHPVILAARRSAKPEFEFRAMQPIDKMMTF